MRAVQLVMWGALGVLLLAAVGAQAAVPAPGDPQWRLPVRVQPAKPTTTDTLTVSFRTARLKADERYEISFGAYDNTSCTPGYRVRLRRQRPGRLVRVVLPPNPALVRGGARVIKDPAPSGGFNTPSEVRFCAGGSAAMVTAVNADDHVRYLGRRAFGLTKDSAYPPVQASSSVKVTVLDGSLTVKTPGRNDRTMQLGGTLRGTIPQLIQLNTDIKAASFTGGLILKSLVPDAVCTGTYATDLSVVPGGASNLVLLQDGTGTLTLQLVADPVSLAGCAAPATPQPTTVVLTGKVGTGGLGALSLTGTIPGVPIFASVTGDVTMNLLVNVDLSGKG